MKPYQLNTPIHSIDEAVRKLGRAARMSLPALAAVTVALASSVLLVLGG